MNKESLMIIIVLLFLLLLWRYSEIRKGWLVFAAFLCIVVALRGAPLDVFTLMILMGLAKLAIDLIDA